jgi:hypothetical protein
VSPDIAPGDVLHGFCAGVFGRDHYTCCTVETVGPDWLVARDPGGALSFAAGHDALAELRQHREPKTDINDDPCCDTPRCSHPAGQLGLDRDRFDLVCRACGATLAERVGDERVPDFSWMFDCPEPRCRASRLSPCVRWDGSPAVVAHGRRWAMYDAALKAQP